MINVRQTSVGAKRYYTGMKDTYADRKAKAEERIEILKEETKVLHNTILESYNANNTLYKCEVTQFKEFVNNEYVNGELYRTAKGILINKDGNFELVGAAYDLYKLAEYQKTIHDLEKEIIKCDKMLSLNMKEYMSILKAFYFKVHEKMILEGCGYAIEYLGFICINRCATDNPKKALDFEATNKRKKELLEQGVRLYNKKEADWCKEHGVEYNGVDYRVYQKVDAYYEIVLSGVKLDHGNNLTFSPIDYTAPELRKLKYEGMKALCNNDTKEICKLETDVRAKLQMCLDIDKTLYTKFIRNENQKPSIFTKIGRKNRQ